MDAITMVPRPVNEPVRTYPAGSAARERLIRRVEELAAGPVELTAAIGGERRPGGGAAVDVVMPHDHKHVLGTFHAATEDDTRAALAAAREAAPGWRELGFDGRAAVFLRAAELLAGPWRDTLNAATMLGQSKIAHEAEIDAACELIDFWRFNVAFAREILADQPASAAGVWNRADHRPLEGFVYAISPFNFTSIAGNLPTAPAIMGNVVLWKPAPTQQFAAHFLMDLLEAAGLPPGVISMLPGDGQAVSAVALADPDLAGIHFTGSTATFQRLWRRVGENIAHYRGYPRLVGETGGKDFVLAHPSADPAVLRAALLRGAFEYQGQKCSAASRAYVPRSLWSRVRDDLVAETEALVTGDVTDPAVFGGALIDARAHARLTAALDRARRVDTLTVLAGGQADDSRGWFVRPTILVGTDPADEAFTTEYFGPLLAVHVYADGDYDRVVARIADPDASRYALTGAVIAQDRAAAARAAEALRFAAGNFYLNDKPTGAVVGQQPFGGARASGTDDKAGSALNLLRWTSPRVIKENLRPPTDHRYPS
ncbi:L-glutamate gamma-semialdehyde dehydrogenase [Frankia sp. CNm7]|uniref:L-glutamate gamma-semialdehyde dehydrogenase n=1 Tax=Frankia nepalensis TaxID=1836974 RepID=A0A937UQT0_9ACTN|nr:L-glutamate gamma-semialdehyde dehydrogenase [Frankia nepalensis]MBL7500105.1 L-glutamate gamma-semialdehyde dehydrogenase [Frankia nepalensis]MBL7512438.1 L-glutamate gamma-semialdehyde dehydrogenase [Frankia nepalensis]MBL7518800.1 L-glutamate gamma-semialdehyde dehydrogenase [Frankia nepalensis]MBL7628575.1 L-glutamate gamma-semialdehyde dehydrogenase [Frankia nepalensis]